MRTLIGVDFTSAPRRAKPITAAHGRRVGGAVRLEALSTHADWPAFEALLHTPGPWLGAFDFPFGLPREGLAALGWPSTDWAAVVRHVAGLAKPVFRAALDADRQRRPMGARYPHRHTDQAARSHSPMKLVNPPVGLMFFEGAPRLLAAGCTLPGLHAGDPDRIAVEAYPGLLARRITPASYKSDARRRQTEERRRAREAIVARLCAADTPLGLPLVASDEQLQALVDDAGGDRLDAVLALLQAAWCDQRSTQDFGLPGGADPLEGWIATL
ncbi:DUF429 domain-containing protein [Denitromonas iodatirespirans]|uniref:DUF429 domain-containing protein n=1 Tax=Denitromonas iodatirespirans TaxID=2795389 RepID=A0A944D7G5_DENI1|nr:DUF429 domain-containing protein [Denitromonas iodatirespirans]MBT0961455.1 DUF429 domain-containing protein [Denitromonas iodatirespirans]